MAQLLNDSEDDVAGSEYDNESDFESEFEADIDVPDTSRSIDSDNDVQAQGQRQA